jgi:hypothetical protein
MAEDTYGLTGVDTTMLEPMVRDLLGEPTAVLAGWSCLPLGGGAGEGLGLYRVSGSARVGADPLSWALVVKVYAATDGADPGAWDYPTREGLAYGSGLLDVLPGGLGAPRCLAVETQPDGTGWLWLEAVTDAHPGPWSLDRYAQVARELGRFNGAYLVGVPLPDQLWVSHGWLRSWVETAGPALAELERLADSGGPQVLQLLYPPAVIVELRRLWEERECFLTALDRLPRTFCHNDAFRRNLLHRETPAGEQLVALDWAYSGHGAVGEELVEVVLGSLFMFEAVGIRPHDLEAACFAGYVAGLREAGWAGNEVLVRLGYTAAAALRLTVGIVQLLLPVVTDPPPRLVVEDLFGRPYGEVVDGWAALWPFQFELAEEARALLPLAG